MFKVRVIFKQLPKTFIKQGTLGRVLLIMFPVYLSIIDMSMIIFLIL